MSRLSRVPTTAQIAVVPPVYTGGVGGVAAQTASMAVVPQAGINEPARWQQEGRFGVRPLVREESYPQQVQRRSLGGLSSSWANAPVPGSSVLPGSVPSSSKRSRARSAAAGQRASKSLALGSTTVAPQ